MFKIGLTEGVALAIVAAILTIVLLVLDKSGKLKGPMLLALLALAAFLTLPLVLNLGWVANSHGTARIARTLLMLCSVGVVYASIAAWSTIDDDEPDEGPKLATQFWQINIGSPERNDSDTAIVLILRVKNEGPGDTIAEDWALTVTLPNQIPRDTLPTYIKPEFPIQLGGEGAGDSHVYSAEDALYTKTTTTPIHDGGGETGILIFTLKDTDPKAVRERGTILTVSCANVKGRRFYSKHVMGVDAASDSQENVYFPGLKPLLRPPAPGAKLTYSQKTVRSKRNDAPFAVRVTIRTNIPLQPTSLAVTCSSEVATAENRLMGASDTNVSNAGSGYVGNDKKIYWFYFNEPVFKPETSVVILLMAKQKVHVLAVDLGPPLPPFRGIRQPSLRGTTER